MDDPFVWISATVLTVHGESYINSLKLVPREEAQVAKCTFGEVNTANLGPWIYVFCFRGTFSRTYVACNICFLFSDIHNASQIHVTRQGKAKGSTRSSQPISRLSCPERDSNQLTRLALYPLSHLGSSVDKQCKATKPDKYVYTYINDKFVCSTRTNLLYIVAFVGLLLPVVSVPAVISLLLARFAHDFPYILFT